MYNLRELMQREREEAEAKKYEEKRKIRMMNDKEYAYQHNKTVSLDPIEFIQTTQTELENKKTLLQQKLLEAQETNRRLNEENQLLKGSVENKTEVEPTQIFCEEKEIMRLNEENRLLQTKKTKKEKNTSMIDLFYDFFKVKTTQ